MLYIAEAGEAGLARFRGKGSDYVWKDTYVFVSDCDRSILLAHPILPEREGQPIAAGPTYGGRNRSVARQRAVRGRPEAGRGVVRVSVPQAEREGTLAEDQLCAGRPWDAVRGRCGRLGRGEITLDELEAVSGRQ